MVIEATAQPTIPLPGREPRSSGYGRRHMSERLCVQIPVQRLLGWVVFRIYLMHENCVNVLKLLKIKLNTVKLAVFDETLLKTFISTLNTPLV